MYQPGQVLDHPHTKYYRCILEVITVDYYHILYIDKTTKEMWENTLAIVFGIYNISDLTIDELKAMIL